MAINKVELMAIEWLKQKGYKESDFVHLHNKSPDFICHDGSRYEVKFLYGDKLIFSKKQTDILKPSDNILVFDRKGFVKQFQWKSRKKTSFQIKVISSENMRKIELERDVAEKLIHLKKVGDTYSDVIKRLLKMERTIYD